MKKCLLLLPLLMIFLIPLILADIPITTDQHTYNLGNKIKASASVMSQSNFDGLFKLAISCGTYRYEYLSTHISLEANFRKAVNPLDDPRATSEMLGKCKIIGDLVANQGNLAVEEKGSNDFEVTSRLSVLPVKTKVTAFPGDSILISGIVNEANGNNVIKAATKIMLDDNSYLTDAIDGKFNITLEIHKGIKSGQHIIGISAADLNGNYGNSSIMLDITAVPTYLKMDLSGDKLMPGSKIEVILVIYDQADNLVNATLELELISPNGNKIFRKNVQSNEKTSYEFSQYAEPGTYLLAGSHKNLAAQSLINITRIREVKVSYGNETVIVENTGNVPFEDELTFILENNLKKFPLTKSIHVNPGKILSIDLSKEVPLGIYDVVAPVKESIQNIKKNAYLLSNLTKGGYDAISGKEDVLAAGVTIHDNRPAYKKIATAFSSISSKLVGADGLIATNPLIAPLSLVIVVLLLIIRYGRKPIMRLIKGRKGDEGKGNEN